MRPIRVAVVGCTHGELDAVYNAIRAFESNGSQCVDLVLCCGDFQAIRDPIDLQTLAVPPQHRRPGDFPRYYNSNNTDTNSPAPQFPLTVFIGGNHESSRHLLEIPLGGWAAPNIFYLGQAGAVRVVVQEEGEEGEEAKNVGEDGETVPLQSHIRVAGLSGIFKHYDYRRGHWECVPFRAQEDRSVYHVREIDVFRLLQLDSPIDVAMSHDWPQGIVSFGDSEALFRRKSFLRNEAQTFGNPAATKLLHVLQPRFWFSGHMHAKFAAVVPHEQDQEEQQQDTQQKGAEEEGGSTKNEGTETETEIAAPAPPQTRFLALGKPAPNQEFMQIVDILPNGASSGDDTRHFAELERSSVVVSPPAPLPPQEPTAESPQGPPRRRRVSLVYDVEWLCVLASTRDLHRPVNEDLVLPTIDNVQDGQRFDFRPSGAEMTAVREAFAAANGVSASVVGTGQEGDPLVISPDNFVRNVNPPPEPSFPNPQFPQLLALLALASDALDAAGVVAEKDSPSATEEAEVEDGAAAVAVQDPLPTEMGRGETDESGAPPLKRARMGDEANP
jgi:Lariat debranching enzyme, C-terminal domain/Calcineurin-like phosphoesterase